MNMRCYWTFTLCAIVVAAAAEDKTLPVSKLGDSVDPPPSGCSIAGGATQGLCGGEEGYKITQCDGLRMHAIFTLSTDSCTSKSADVLNDCADKHNAGATLPAACKVAKLDFKVQGQQAWDEWTAKFNRPDGLCATEVQKITNNWYNSALGIVNAKAEILCGAQEELGESLEARARAPMTTDYVESSTCSPQECAGISGCPAYTATNTGEQSEMKTYQCMGGSPPPPPPPGHRRRIAATAEIGSGYQVSSGETAPTVIGQFKPKGTNKANGPKSKILGTNGRMMKLGCREAQQTDFCMHGNRAGSRGPGGAPAYVSPGAMFQQGYCQTNPLSCSSGVPTYEAPAT